MAKEKRWYEYAGHMYLIKNGYQIREYRYNHAHDRKRIHRIWMSELTLTDYDIFEIIISPEI